jgi:hypothetical protein
MVASAQPLAAPAPLTDDSTLDLSYGKARAAVKGQNVIVIFLLALLVCCQLWFSWHVLSHADTQHTAILDEIQIQTYILSRPESERPQLAMPKALYDRLARQPWAPLTQEKR